MSEYLRMSGVYWGLTAMDLLGQLHRMNKEEILAFIKSCQHECGGISASIGHDPHLLYTLSAVQVKLMSKQPFVCDDFNDCRYPTLSGLDANSKHSFSTSLKKRIK